MSAWLTPENVKSFIDALVLLGIGVGGGVGTPRILQYIRNQKEMGLTPLPPIMKPPNGNGNSPMTKSEVRINCLENMEHCRSEVFEKFTEVGKEQVGISTAMSALCGQVSSIEGKLDRVIERRSNEH